MKTTHIIHEGWGDYDARKWGLGILVVFLSGIFIIIGIIGFFGSIIYKDFKNTPYSIIFLVIGIIIFGYWWIKTGWVLRYKRQRDKSPINRISFG